MKQTLRKVGRVDKIKSFKGYSVLIGILCWLLSATGISAQTLEDVDGITSRTFIGTDWIEYSTRINGSFAGDIIEIIQFSPTNAVEVQYYDGAEWRKLGFVSPGVESVGNQATGFPDPGTGFGITYKFRIRSVSGTPTSVTYDFYTLPIATFLTNSFSSADAINSSVLSGNIIALSSPLTAQIVGITNPPSCGVADGAVNITVTGGSGSYLILPNPTGLAAGTYLFTIQDQITGEKVYLQQTLVNNPPCPDPQPVTIAWGSTVPQEITDAWSYVNVDMTTSLAAGTRGNAVIAGTGLDKIELEYFEVDDLTWKPVDLTTDNLIFDGTEKKLFFVNGSLLLRMKSTATADESVAITLYTVEDGLSTANSNYLGISFTAKAPVINPQPVTIAWGNAIPQGITDAWTNINVDMTTSLAAGTTGEAVIAGTGLDQIQLQYFEVNTQAWTDVDATTSPIFDGANGKSLYFVNGTMLLRVKSIAATTDADVAINIYTTEGGVQNSNVIGTSFTAKAPAAVVYTATLIDVNSISTITEVTPEWTEFILRTEGNYPANVKAEVTVPAEVELEYYETDPSKQVNTSGWQSLSDGILTTGFPFVDGGQVKFRIKSAATLTDTTAVTVSVSLKDAAQDTIIAYTTVYAAFDAIPAQVIAPVYTAKLIDVNGLSTTTLITAEPKEFVLRTEGDYSGDVRVVINWADAADADSISLQYYETDPAKGLGWKNVIGSQLESGFPFVDGAQVKIRISAGADSAQVAFSLGLAEITPKQADTVVVLNTVYGAFDVVPAAPAFDLAVNITKDTVVVCKGEDFVFDLKAILRGRDVTQATNDSTTFKFELIEGVVDILGAKDSAYIYNDVPKTALQAGKAVYRITPLFDSVPGIPAIIAVESRLPLTAYAQLNSDLILKNGDQVNGIQLSFNLPEGAVVQWTNVINGDSVEIGLNGQSGIGLIPPFVATNTTSDTITGAIKFYLNYADSLACLQTDAYTRLIKVAPRTISNIDLVAGSVASQTVCYNDAFAQINFTAYNAITKQSVANVEYLIEFVGGTDVLNSLASRNLDTLNTQAGEWRIDTIAVEERVSGTGTYRVTPRSGNGEGKSTVFNLTVKPEPKVYLAGDTIVACSGSPLSITFSGYEANTIYEWTTKKQAGTTGIGLPAKGTGNINLNAVKNSTNAVIADTIIVTPYIAGCDGVADTIVVKVLPTPQVGFSIPNIILGNDSTLTLANVYGKLTLPLTPIASYFLWENDNPAISSNGQLVGGTVQLDGTGFPAFTATNGSAEPVKGKITITPVWEENDLICTGKSAEFYILVASKPSINAIADLNLCEGDQSKPVQTSGLPAGNSYFISWTGGAEVGLADHAESDARQKFIPSFVAQSTEPSGLTIDTIKVVPKIALGVDAGGQAIIFDGDTVKFAVTVSPKVVLHTNYAEYITETYSECEGATLSFDVEVIAGTNLTYQWYKNHIAIAGETSSTYDIDDLSTADAGIYYVVVNGDCSSAQSKTYEVLVRIPVLQQRWDDVILLITNPDYNGGYTFSNIEWYEDNSGSLTKVIGENKTYLYVDGGVDGKTYIARAIIQDGSTYETCPFTGAAPSTSQTVSVYPNPVKAGKEITVETKGFTEQLKIQIVDNQGRILTTQAVSGESTQVRVPNTIGVYVLRILIIDASGYLQQKEYKVIVE